MRPARYAFAAGALLVVMLGFHFATGGGASSPQTLLVKAGSTAPVGGRRAKLWFAQPTEVYARDRINDAAMVTLTCGGNEQALTLVKGEAAQPACGLRIELLEIREPDAQSKVFRGTFRITW